MSHELDSAAIADRFLLLPLTRKLLFLCTYSHQITILARMYLIDANYEGARRANELLHRILGHSTTTLSGVAIEAEKSFIEMLCKAAVQVGWGEILMQSLKRTEGAPTRSSPESGGES